MPIIAIIGGFLPGLFGKTLPFKTARIVGFITIAVAVIAILAMGKCAYDRSIIKSHDAAQEAKASGAREDAADQRATDTINNANSEKELHDAIQAAPTGGSLSPAALALSCERLRRIGRVSPACGHPGGNGTQASPN